MLLMSHRIRFALFVLAFSFAMMLMTSKAGAQTTNCMSMGGGMVHCNTLGSGGGMSSTDCMAMGQDMATCNTMSMGGATMSGGPVASPVEIYRMIFGDKTRKEIGRLLASGDCEGAARYAYSHSRLELGTKIAQTCRPSDAPSYAALSQSPAYGQRPLIVASPIPNSTRAASTPAATSSQLRGHLKCVTCR